MRRRYYLILTPASLFLSYFGSIPAPTPFFDNFINQFFLPLRIGTGTFLSFKIFSTAFRYRKSKIEAGDGSGAVPKKRLRLQPNTPAPRGSETLLMQTMNIPVDEILVAHLTRHIILHPDNNVIDTISSVKHSDPLMDKKTFKEFLVWQTLTFADLTSHLSLQ